MIHFEGGLSAERDIHGWKLHQEITSKSGKVRTKTTYYATLKQVCAEVIERSIGECPDVQRVLDTFEGVTNLLTTAASEVEK